MNVRKVLGMKEWMKLEETRINDCKESVRNETLHEPGRNSD